MQPFVQPGVQKMGIFPFDTQENASDYDYDALLTDAQRKFCDWCRENVQADKIPDEMTLDDDRHAPLCKIDPGIRAGGMISLLSSF